MICLAYQWLRVVLQIDGQIMTDVNISRSWIGFVYKLYKVVWNLPLWFKIYNSIEVNKHFRMSSVFLINDQWPSNLTHISLSSGKIISFEGFLRCFKNWSSFKAYHGFIWGLNLILIHWNRLKFASLSYPTPSLYFLCKVLICYITNVHFLKKHYSMANTNKF